MDIDALTAPSMMGRMTPLHETRLDQVLRRLKGSGARRVLDLGCGSGHLLYRLAGEPQFEQIVGLETCAHSLRQARELLADHLQGDLPRLDLINGSYTESQHNLEGYDAAAMVETIEHLKPGALSAAEQVVFGQMRPAVVYMTTPNREYNPLYGLRPGEFREADHEFEWDRDKFRHWSQGVARRNGYRVTLGGIGEADPEFGQPTQTAWFTRLD
ncbi:methyltransferase domain-containing protein [Thiohalophilus sp.]|uniref:methyltransferase domain-containing protein n=1 Tax=Thiohalophilus sp. TaxID=3028392 RepID=UPI002ACE3C62|nr:methyltransferase domain-containing protein [Thiohalophilus sp.]MDZ7802734.1 methyltransferase domain-containing protein [Thiohalophilus sp.]